MQGTQKVLGPCLAAATAMAICASPAMANVIQARSGSSEDIQAAVNQAQAGDTVSIPAGRFSFTGQVYAPDGIHIEGAGRDATFLIKTSNLGEWQAMFTIDAKTGQPFIFSGITLQGRLDALQGSNRTTAVTDVKDQGILIKGAAKNVQIYGSRFTKFTRAGIEFVGEQGTVPGSQTGVIYHNEFIDNWYTYLGYGVSINGVPSTWDGPVTLGTASALFVEDNYFERCRHCVTASDGANYVARYNTVNNNYPNAQSFDAHGLSPAWPAGTRSVEIYKNVVTNSPSRYAGAGIRGGGGVIWGNTWNGVAYGVVLSMELPPSSAPLSAYPALQQIGYKDDLYIWDNSSTGDQVSLGGASVPNGIDYWLKQNRDYFLSPMPGYQPYTYPHPLRAPGT